MGHTDATFTMAVYQQVLDMGPGSVEALETVFGCSLEEARAIHNGAAEARVLPRSSPVGGRKASVAEPGSNAEA